MTEPYIDEQSGNICITLSKADNLEGGIRLAAELIDIGAAMRKLEEFIKETA